MYLNSLQVFNGVLYGLSIMYMCLSGLAWCHFAFFGVLCYLLLQILLGDI